VPRIITRAQLPVSGVYNTSFPLIENPISEAGAWKHNNTSRANVKTTAAHLAFGTGANNDGYAYLSGWSDSIIETTVFRSASLLDTEANSYEIEHLHRLTDGASFTNCYELDMAYNGGFNIVRWSGATSFAVLTGLVTDTNFWPDGGGGQLRDGYKIKTEMIAASSTINIYSDSGSGYVKYFHYVLGTDATNDATPLSSGDPAISFFTTISGNDWLGMKSAKLTKL
jgi:hypothetical protein